MQELSSENKSANASFSEICANIRAKYKSVVAIWYAEKSGEVYFRYKNGERKWWQKVGDKFLGH